MPIFDIKLDLINQLSALRSLSSSFPKLSLGNTMPSLNNLSNPLDFLLDLIKTLIGFDEIKQEVIKFLTINATKIEQTIKDILLEILKSKFSCSIDALIPNNLIDGLGIGFNVAVNQVDFFEILKIDPESQFGKMIYETNTQDLNIFLYNVLQGNVGSWQGLLVISFQQYGIVDGDMKSNVFNVKIDSDWTGKTVNDFMNAFLAKIQLFTTPTLIANIFDIIFGSISFNIGKGANQIKNEAELDVLINKIVNLPDTIIDNSYFEFDKQDVDYLNDRINERTDGRLLLKNCDCVYSSIDINDLQETVAQLQNASTLVEIKTILDNQFNVMVQTAGQNLPATDVPNFNANFFATIFNAILKALVNILLSPKVLFVIITYFKIVNLSIGFKNFKDFLTEFRQFIIDIIRKTILPILIEFLLKLVIKYVSKLVAQDQISRGLDMVKNLQLQILSLVGVPQQIRDLISKLSV